MDALYESYNAHALQLVIMIIVLARVITITYIPRQMGSIPVQRGRKIGKPTIAEV